MKGKYIKKKERKNPLVTVFLLVVLAAAVAAVIWWIRNEQPAPDTGASNPSETVGNAAASEPEKETLKLDAVEPVSINLGHGLILEDVGSYTGAYMEDGSNEIVSGVMMALVTNTAENDLQYAKIAVSDGAQTFDFEVSDLPAGASVVLLEKNRQAMPAQTPTSATAENVVFFAEPMSAKADFFEISGMEGALNIRNVSDSDITGDIYIHYKYRSQDVYYGGIAFRAKVEGGLKAGEIRQIMTGHFNDTCEVLLIEYTA